MKRTLALAAVLLVALAGCTATPPAPTTAPTAEPTPTPTLRVETGTAQPGRVFQGQCGGFDILALSEIVGVALEFRDETPVPDFATALLWQSGALTCHFSDADHTVFLALSAAPTDAVGELPAPADCAPNTTDTAGDVTCGLEWEANGVTVAGLVGISGARSAAAVDAASTVAASLTRHLETVTTADVATEKTLPASGAWANPGRDGAADRPSCTDLDRLIVSPSFLGGEPRGNVERVLPVVGYLSPIDLALGGHDPDDPSTCVWITTRTPEEIASGRLSQFQARLLGGGAWVLDTLENDPTSEEIRIDGVDRAIRIGAEGEPTLVWVASGPNAAVFTYNVGQKDAAYGSTALVVAARNRF